MLEIALFVEDAAHQKFLDALLDRVAAEYGVDISKKWGNVRRGHGAVIHELNQYLRDLRRSRSGMPHLVIAATDANCKGFNVRHRDIMEVFEKNMLSVDAIAAIPDPHIERWLLIDSSAFRAVFGRGCDAPDRKCEKGRYKKQLIDAIRNTGRVPSFGGIEFSDEIVLNMDLEWVERNDNSLGRLLVDLRDFFQRNDTSGRGS